MLIDLQHVNNQSLRFAALWYTAQGFRVFPVHPGAKTPLVSWSLEATTDWRKVREWWTRWPNANIGLAMGDGRHCLDVDVGKHGDDGLASYEAVGGEPWGEIRLPVQITPGGGRHVLFLDSLREYRNFTRKGPRGGLDMRTDGGYILVAPSHVAGRPYQWVGPGDLEANIPDALLEFMEKASRGVRADRGEEFPLVEPSSLTEEQKNALVNALPAPQRAFLREGVAEGGDMSAQAYWSAYTAFRWGWSLEDMAAIGPDTTLGHFGAQPPHSAPDPWTWCWKYTIRAAWEASDGQRWGQLFAEEEPGEKENPGKGADEGRGAAGVKAVTTELHRTSESSVATRGAQDILADLLTRAKALEPGDVQGIENLLLACAKLDPDALRVDALLQEIKRFGGSGLGALRERYKALIAAERGRKAQETRAGESAAEVYIRDQGKLYDRLSGQLVSEQAFRSAKAREHGGDTEQAMQHWVHGASAVCEVVESLQYDPGLGAGVATDHRGVKVFNTYRGSDVVPKAGDASMWLGLLDALNLGGGYGEREAFLDYLAYLVQQPGGKANHGVMLGGRHGIGKDSFLAPVLEAIGNRNVTTVSGDEVANPAFNAYLGHCKLLVVNEIQGKGTAETLKPALACPPAVIRVNKKNQQPYDVPNRLALVAMTNHYYPFQLDPGERRWLCLWSHLELPPDAGHPLRLQWDRFFADYWTWVRSGKAAASVSWWLHERDLSQYRPGARPVVTVWQQDLEMDTADPLDDWVRSQIVERSGALGLDVCDIDSIVSDAQRVTFGFGGFGGDKVTAKRMARSLARVGVGRRRVKASPSFWAYLPHGADLEVTSARLRALKQYQLRAGTIAPI